MNVVILYLSSSTDFYAQSATTASPAPAGWLLRSRMPSFKFGPGHHFNDVRRRIVLFRSAGGGKA